MLPQTSDDYSISLEFFTGPMDVLLHLVHQQEVSIEQVSMRVIAERYLEIVSAARFLDLEKASEYLVIAATLMSIKSASLLPSQNLQEENPEENSAAFYEELRERLRKYELTKSRARALIELPQLGVDVFSRVDRKALLPTAEMLAEPESVTTLGVLFGRLLRRVGDTVKTYRIRLDGVSVVSHMMRIVDMLSDNSGKDAAPASSNQAGSRRSFRFLMLPLFSRSRAAEHGKTAAPRIHGYTDEERGAVIGSFIAVLELVKRGLLAAFQPNERDDIQLELKMSPTAEGENADAEFKSEFDIEISNQATADSNIVDMQKYRRQKESGEGTALELHGERDLQGEPKRELKEVGNSGT